MIIVMQIVAISVIYCQGYCVEIGFLFFALYCCVVIKPYGCGLRANWWEYALLGHFISGIQLTNSV